MKPGTTDGNVTAVEGIQPNAIVAISGFDRLQDGAPVAIRSGGSSGAGMASGQGDSDGTAAATAADDQKGSGRKKGQKSQRKGQSSNGDATP